MPRDVRPVLRAGSLAVADCYRYAIPCKVIEILPGLAHLVAEIPHSAAPSSQAVRVKLTATRGPYKRGETIELCARDCYPRDAFFPRRYGARIGYYTVELTKEA